jgi:hypothetical protein
MQLLHEVEKKRDIVQASIDTYGYAPEHNFDWYVYNTEPNQTAIVALWPDGTLLLTNKEKKEWYVFSEPVMPVRDAGTHIVEFASRAFEDTEIKKIVFELRVETRKTLLDALPKTLRACAINYSLVWPIMNMKSFDLALPGGHWKHIRNARNAFYRDHSVEVVPVQSREKEELHSLIDAWKETRQAHDRAYTHAFHRLIDGLFCGTSEARAFIVDGKLRGINAGWKIPNSDFYYGSVGIHDYSQRDLGLLLYLEDLVWLKERGYLTVDMGGGEGALTIFKNQFLPERWYKTFVFSIVRR